MADLLLGEELRKHLITQGVVRATLDGPGPLPPCILNPKDGAPQPVGDDTAYVTLRDSGQIPSTHLEGFLEEPILEVIVRARKSAAGILLQRVIRGQLNDRRDFTLGDLHVQWCLLWRGIQPVPLAPGAMSTSYDSTQSFRFQIRTAELTA